MYSTPSLSGFLLEFCNSGGLNKLDDAPTRASNKCDDMFIP